MKRMYVIVREDLTKSQKTVQCIHAVSELLLKGKSNNWNNGKVVCLKVRNEFELNLIANRLNLDGIGFEFFKEPDLNSSLTSIALISENKMFEELELL
jgi:peptidyl-tRNA hydrolase